MRRHFKAAEFHQPQPAGGAVGRIELVDADFGAVGIAGGIGQQVAEDAVHQPGRDIGGGARRDFVEGDFQLVQRVVPRFVDARRLAGGADEQAARTDRTARDGSANRPPCFSAGRGGAGRGCRAASARPPRCDCRRRCRCGGRRAGISRSTGAQAAASSYSALVMSTCSRQFLAGWILTSITPGSGVTLMTLMRGS